MEVFDIHLISPWAVKDPQWWLELNQTKKIGKIVINAENVLDRLNLGAAANKSIFVGALLRNSYNVLQREV